MDVLSQFGERKIMFVKQLHSSFLCMACKNILQKPKQTSCGHRICEDCLESLKK